MLFMWFVLILLCVLLYVVLDGYDLGIGMATLLERDESRRREMIELVAVAWDGNETWLVLAGVSLWVGFPLAFGTILPHAFLPLIVMLFALITRGVSVEMVSERPPAPVWQKAFGVCSLIAVLALGTAAGTLTAPLAISGSAYNGSAFGAMGWYSALTALALVAICLSLGYAYLKWKTAGPLQDAAGRRGLLSAVAAVVLGGVALGALGGTAAPLELSAPVRAAGFAWLMVAAAAGAVMAAVAFRARWWNSLPMLGLAIAVVATVLAVVVARYPVLVPPELTVDRAASPGGTFEFVAVGMGLNVPLILFYSWYAHYAFRGKQPSASGAEPNPGPGTPDISQEVS